MSPPSKEKDQNSGAATSGQERLTSGLYLVATPIGNLRDISLRALETLKACDLILCEDTRVTRKLLQHYGVRKKCETYHDHSSKDDRARIIEKILNGNAVALVSDAGMPLISDPGYKLVRDCQVREIYVTTIPGASASLAALQLSGLPADRFCFIGYLPPKKAARQALLREWSRVPASVVAYETAPRLLKALEDIQEICPDRRLAVVREITKLYEEVKCDTASSLLAYYEQNGLPKGEIVLVLAAREKGEPDDEDIALRLTQLLETMTTKEAAGFLADETGLSRSALYEKALAIKADRKKE